jgi:hypothetical protein
MPNKLRMRSAVLGSRTDRRRPSMNDNDTEAHWVVGDVRTDTGESLEDQGGFGPFLQSWGLEWGNGEYDVRHLD